MKLPFRLIEMQIRRIKEDVVENELGDYSDIDIFHDFCGTVFKYAKNNKWTFETDDNLELTALHSDLRYLSEGRLFETKGDAINALAKYQKMKEILD